MSSVTGQIALTIGIDRGALDSRRVAARVRTTRPTAYSALASAIPVTSRFAMPTTMAAELAMS